MALNPYWWKDKCRNTWRIRVYSRRLYYLLKARIQEVLSNANEHLVGGLFDAEGDFTESKRRLRFVNKSWVLIRLVGRFLERCGIV